jgi:hypothetical protein
MPANLTSIEPVQEGMRRSSLPKPVRDGLAIGAIILVIVALVWFAGAPRTLAVSAPTPVQEPLLRSA